MAATWGEAEVQLHIDGDSLPGEVRAATIAAAQEGGKQFQKTFNKSMRGAAKVGVKNFARDLKELVRVAVRSSGAMRKMYDVTLTLRKGFTNLRSSMNDLTKKGFTAVATGVKNLGRAMRDENGTLGMLREGAKFLRIDLEDVAQTFPGITRAVNGTKTAFRNTISEVKGFGSILRTDAIKTMDTLRDGASKLKISLDDVKDTFPGITRAVQGTRNAFTRVGAAARRAGTAVKNLGPDMEETAPAFERLRESTRKMLNTFRNIRVLTDDVRGGLVGAKTATDDLTESTDEVNRSTKDTDRSLTRTRKSLREHVGGVRKMLSVWKRMPHGLRQAVFWIGLVIAAMGTLSVVGSGLSGTIVTLVTMLTALGAGAGIAAVGFAGLFGEGEKLTAGAQASKKAFEDLGAAFHGLQTGITNNMFANMATSIEGITNNLLPALEGSINSFAGQIGTSLGKVFDALSSPAAIENFKALLEGFGPIFDSLVDAVIGFGGGLGNVLVASLPTAQAFADAIRDVGERFSEWTSSEEGRKRLAEFFDTAERIMPALVDLVVAFGKAISGLVTPTTIKGAETFIASLTDFMPVLGEMVGIIANLNVFGILAAALELIGALLTPIIPVLQEFATIIGEQLIAGLETLQPAFAKLGEAIAPILEIIGVLITAILPPLIDVIVSVVEYIASWIEILIGADTQSKEFSDAIKVMGDIVGTIFEILGATISSVLEFTIGIFKTVAALLKGDFSGAFQIMYDMVSGILENFGVDIDDVIKWFEDLLKNVESVFDGIVGAIETAVREVGNFLRDLWKPIQDAIGWFNSLFGAADDAGGAASSASNSGSRGAPPRFASGGILSGPRRILAGEAGPEAIVPLRRNLSQVDPAVRWLSAMAQDKPMASGGIVGAGGRTVTVAPGAIVIQGSTDPQRTSIAVLNRLAERIAG